LVLELGGASTGLKLERRKVVQLIKTGGNVGKEAQAYRGGRLGTPSFSRAALVPEISTHKKEREMTDLRTC